MKNRVGTLLASLLLGVLAFGPAAQAQQLQRVIKVNIPFDFSVNGKAYPAGKYRVVSVAPAILQLRDADDHCLAVVLTNSVESLNAPETSKLHFYSDGGQYVLTEVWQEDSSIGQQLLLSNSSLRTAKRDSKHRITIAADRPH
jgi:hypothetical protein